MLQGRLAGRLAREVVGAEVGRQVGIGGRVPLVGVDAVEDAHQVAAALAQHAVQAAPEGRCLDLLGVGGADGGEEGGVAQRRLHEVQRSEVLELGGVVVLSPQPGDEHGAAVGHALVGHVVDGEHGGGAVERPGPFHRVDVDGNQRRLPVVGVDHVRHEVDRLAELERAAREEGEALQVVRVALAGRAVEVRPIEVPVVLEEVDRDVAARQVAQPESGAGHAPPHGHPDGSLQPLQRVPVEAGVEGHDHADVDATPAQRPGQRAGDVGQAACLGERGGLRGDEEDLEATLGLGHSIRSRRGGSRRRGRCCPSPRCRR